MEREREYGGGERKTGRRSDATARIFICVSPRQRERAKWRGQCQFGEGGSYPCCCCSSGPVAVLVRALPLLGPPTGKPLRSNAWTFPPTGGLEGRCVSGVPAVGGPGPPRFSPHELAWPLSRACLTGEVAEVVVSCTGGGQERPPQRLPQKPLRSLTVNSRRGSGMDGRHVTWHFNDPEFCLTTSHPAALKGNDDNLKSRAAKSYNG